MVLGFVLLGQLERMFVDVLLVLVLWRVFVAVLVLLVVMFVFVAVLVVIAAGGFTNVCPWCGLG